MPLRILHAHSTFDLGGKEARAVRLMQAFGDAARHVVLSGTGRFGAREAVGDAVHVDFPDDAPPLTGSPSLKRLRRLAAYTRGFDLVLTYNWGAFDMVMARRLFARSLQLPPLVHHEDGFNQDEAARLNLKRNLYRRIGLPAAHRLVVPSQRLERVALETWKQPHRRVQRIANGIPVAGFDGRHALPRLEQRPGEVVIGTAAGLRPVKNLPMMVRAAEMAEGARLMIVGEGPERAGITAEAARTDMAERLHMPGFLPDPATFMGAFDIFALSSDSEQFPISLIEAMAAGLPVAATDVGDVRAMVAPENLPFIVPAGDAAALGGALARLAADPELRAAVGRANRAKAEAEYDEGAMIAAYAALYDQAAGTRDLREAVMPRSP